MENYNTIINNDIKIENVLIKSRTKDKIEIVVCDFGITSFAVSPEHKVNTIYGGTPYY